MSLNRIAMAALLAAATILPAQAAVLLPHSGWQAFDIDDLMAASGGTEWIDNTTGAALGFEFTLAGPATLRVVDGGFAGDSFSIVVDGVGHVSSNVPLVRYEDGPASVGLNFDEAWSNAAYSRFELVLGAGAHSVSGRLLQSVRLGDLPLNATVGGISLVPEPASLATLLAGLGLLTLVLRRGAKK